MSYNYKCTTAGCRRRKTTKKPIDWYAREPRCPHCKVRNKETGRLIGGKFKLDLWTKPRDKARTCNCGAYSHPHSKCKWCVGNEHTLTEQDYLDRYGSRYTEEVDPIAQMYEDWEQYLGMRVDN